MKQFTYTTPIPLGVKSGDTVIITVEGGNEDTNLETLQKFFEENL